MKVKKLTLMIFGLITLNGCVDGTALLGPAISVGTSGNVYQAGLSYTSNQVLYRATGKTPVEHISSLLDPKNEFEGDLNLILADNIGKIKKVLDKSDEKIISKKDKKNEIVSDLILEDQFILF
tara:strand:+ start:280 stop:648 length:369 start_codon:yes stop_codon:yes gene_type:complete